MDRDTIRIVLLVIGLLVIAGIYIWGRHRQKLLDFLQRRGEYDELGYDPGQEAPPPKSRYQDPDDDEFESLGYKGRKPAAPEPAAYGLDDELDNDLLDFGQSKPAPEPPPAKSKPEAAAKTPPEPKKTTGSAPIPVLIQVSVVASGGRRYFQGDDLRDALLDLDLIHGSMGIFHRYDRKFRETLFSVASLVEPGTFPMDNMEAFECPGVVLFFQPDRVSNPIAVFDDLVRTSHKLANRLGGAEWDEKRQPLTQDKIAHMRGLLEDACEDS